MNILHANTDPDLLTRLKEMLGSSARADFAVGYFFIGGFDALADDLARLDRVRILVGRADRMVLEEAAAGLQQADALRAKLDSDSLVRRGERAAVARQAVDGVGEGVSAMPQSAESERAVRRLRDMIAVGRVQVRAYLRSPLHAKAYLCWYDNHAEPGSAVVGSSNFTLAGFSGNTELNVRVAGDAEMAELSRWFNSLWDDSEDIGDSLAAELERSWALAQTPPYHVYLKALHELYREELGESAPSAPPMPAAPRLTNFQADAAARALGMIEARGGCYIGDVVGLGKTFIGAEILRQLNFSYRGDGPPLILSPARLVPMWRRVSEMFALGAEVVSHSAIAAPPDADFDEETGRYADGDSTARGVVLEREYPNRGAVLVDEAHNFRNRNKRYAGLAAYLESGDHKVILMSATPQNLGPKDVYRQLRLFLDETEHGLNLEPLSLEDYFGNIEKWREYRAEHENYLADFAVWESDGRRGAPPIPPPRPAVPRADMESVLTPVFIRRRRRDIRDLYGDSAEIDGEPVRFPTPTLANVDYRLDKVYAKAGAFGELQALLKSHKAARYRAANYLKPEARGEARYADLLRARNRIAQLMGALLLKRLESSIEAFRSTTAALMRSNRNFRAALEGGYVPIGTAAARLLSGESFDADDALAILAQEEERRGRENGGGGARRAAAVHPADDFETGDWLRDIDADYRVLSETARRVQDIGAEDDDKLRALKAFLADPEVKAGKVLIFSEAETTIEYLHRELNPNGGDPKIARLTGSDRSAAEGIIRRFSPTWNGGTRRGESEIDVLLATDIVSEGQNLQDCARILNYDLHWNPVRLIQRFGRVDRIGTEHARIHLHNMWPDTEVDETLSLTERLRNRVQSFHDMIGLDSKLLSESERLNEDAMYRIYAGGELPEPDDDLDEAAANQRSIALLQRIRREDPNLWDAIINLPDGIRSALSVGGAESAGGESRALSDGMQNVLSIEGGQPPLVPPPSMSPSRSPFDPPSAGETVVLLRQGDVLGCYAAGGDLQARPISPAQFAAAAECDPDTPAAPLPADANARVMAAFDAFRSDMGGRLGRSRRRRDTRNRRYLSRQLNIIRRRTEGGEREHAETLRRVFLADVPPQAESHLTAIRDMRLEGDSLIARLNALRERYRLNPPDEGAPPQPPAPAPARVVCSDGLV